MKVSASRVRFVLEAAFLVVVAAVCYEAHLSWRGIVPAMAVAWALVTLVERTAMRDHSSLRAGRLGALFGAFGEHAAAEPQPASEPAPSHVTVLEPPEEHPPEPQPEPMPAPEPVPEPEPPTPEPVPPAPTLRPLPAPPEPALEAPLREPAVAYLPRRDGAEREWNVWELEQIAHAQEGEDAA